MYVCMYVYVCIYIYVCVCVHVVIYLLYENLFPLLRCRRESTPTKEPRRKDKKEERKKDLLIDLLGSMTRLAVHALPYEKKAVEAQRAKNLTATPTIGALIGDEEQNENCVCVCVCVEHKFIIFKRY